MSNNSHVFLSSLLLVALSLVACDTTINSAPEVTDVQIVKDRNPVIIAPDDLMAISYTYSDVEGDAEASSTFQWFRDGTAISGEVDSSYILSSEDIDHVITVSVTPIAATGTANGETVVSSNYSLEAAIEAWAIAQTEQFGPILYMHPNEQFMPSSVEWYAKQTMLVGSDGNLDCNAVTCVYYEVAQGGGTDQELLDTLVSVTVDNSSYTMQHEGQLPEGHYNSDLEFIPTTIPASGKADLTFAISELEIICPVVDAADCLAVGGPATSRHQLIWNETHRDVSIDSDGSFSVVLGVSRSMAEVARKLDSTQLSLNVQVNGFGQLVPFDPGQLSSFPLLGEQLLGPIDRPLHDAMWLETLDVTNPGDLAQSKTYVHALLPNGLDNVVDIQYWFFYPFNGPGRARVQLGDIHDQDSSLTPLGEHYGDWEVATLRFDAVSNELLGAFMSAHGEYTWYPKNQLLFEDGHVLAFPSLNGHAIYNSAVSHAFDNRVVHFYIGWENECIGFIDPFFDSCVGYRTDVGIGTLDVDLLNTTGYGQKFEAFNNYEMASIQGVATPGQEWIDLDLRWGQQRGGSATDLTSEQIQNVLQDQLGIVALLTGVGAVAACNPLVLAIPVVGAAFCASYLLVVVPTVIVELSVGGALLELAADEINKGLGDDKIFNGPKTPGAKDEYYYLVCPAESESDVVCPGT